MMKNDGHATGARIGRIAADVARYLRDDCDEHDPGDAADALAGLAGEVVALRTETDQQFERELGRLVGVMVAHARFRRQALGGPTVAGHA